MRLITRLACALAFGIFASAPASADHDRGKGKSEDHGRGKSKVHKGAPAPVTGAGLPFLIAAGAFAAFKRRRQPN